MAIFGRVTHVIWLSAGEDPTSIFYLSNVVSDLAQGEVNSVNERSLLTIYSTLKYRALMLCSLGNILHSTMLMARLQIVVLTPCLKVQLKG